MWLARVGGKLVWTSVVVCSLIFRGYVIGRQVGMGTLKLAIVYAVRLILLFVVAITNCHQRLGDLQSLLYVFRHLARSILGQTVLDPFTLHRGLI